MLDLSEENTSEGAVKVWRTAIIVLVLGFVLKGIEYNSSTKGKYPNGKEIVSIGSTENCESEKWDTEVEKDKKESFDNVTNASWI